MELLIIYSFLLLNSLLLADSDLVIKHNLGFTKVVNQLKSKFELCLKSVDWLVLGLYILTQYVFTLNAYFRYIDIENLMLEF